jgi:hypothetical protein
MVMRVSTLVLVVAASITAAACDGSTAPGDMRLARLTQQEARWDGQNLHDYFFEYHYQFAGAIEAARIYIMADTVAGVLELATDSSLSLDPQYGWPTVEDLFARAKEALSEEHVDVTVEYDEELGYPTRIDVSPKVATPAGGSSTRASGLEPLAVLMAGQRRL